MKFFPLLLLALPLVATVNEPWRFELFTGYRSDRVHWHLQQGGEGDLLYSELYRDLQFWENGLTLKTIHRDLFFLFSGDYATFGRGTLFQRYAQLDFTSEQPRFQFHTNGWAADGTGYFGYAVNLTTGRTYKVLLIPLIGFSGHFEYLQRKDPSPNPFIGSDFTMQSSLPGKLHLTWYGFLLGGGFLVEPGGPLIFQAGYTYHWLHLNFKTKFQNQVSDQITTNSFHAKEGGNLGHTGWLQIDFILPQLWRLGIGAQIHYFSSSVLSVNVKQNATDLDQKFKLRWTPISGWLQVSREF